jgi:guanylate kinase
MLILLFGRSGSGKTRLANYLTEKYDIEKIISATTKGKEDSDGDYYYLTEEQFKATHMAEWAKVEGNLYGIPMSEITKGVNKPALAVVDWQGVVNLEEAEPITFKLDVEFSDLVDNYIDRGMTFDEALSVINDEIMYDLVESDLIIYNDMITPVQELAEEVLNEINFYKGEK